MPTVEECIDDIGTLIATLATGGPILRIGKITAVTATRITVDGFNMPYIDVGVTPVTGRVVAYLRQGTGAVGLGMLAT